MKVKNIYTVPRKIRIGETFAVKMDSELSEFVVIVLSMAQVHIIEEEVTSGEVKVSLEYGSTIPLLDETVRLCDLVTQIDRLCPLKKGSFNINIPNKKIPDNMPPVSCNSIDNFCLP